MKLIVKYVDMRGNFSEATAWQTEVIDEVTGQVVGYVHAERAPHEIAFRDISLFGGKYQARFSTNNSIAECEAFAKGVEAVLNHMTDITDGQRT